MVEAQQDKIAEKDDINRIQANRGATDIQNQVLIAKKEDSKQLIPKRRDAKMLH